MMKKKFTLFYGGPASQWTIAPIGIDGNMYNCCEQYMMAKKALLFEDEKIYYEIILELNPSKQKALGKKVKNFNKDQWEVVAKDIVYRANMAKFTQHKEMREWLFSTKRTTIVEASPTDKIWGIGLAEDDPDALDPAKWKGTNWLGEIVTQVREDLLTK